MSISNGEKANATNFNDAFVSRDVNTNTIGKLDLNNTATESGTQILNVQKEHNSRASFLGQAVNQAKDNKPTWVSDTIGAPSDDVKTRVDNVQSQVELNTLNKTDKVSPSTDNGIVRFDGVAGVQQSSGVTIDDSDNMIIPGNVTVQGDTTIIGETITTDPLIEVNDTGNQAAADAAGAGIKVRMTDATDAGLRYDSALASKFGIGEDGSETEIITSTLTQSMSGKTVTQSDLDLTGVAGIGNRAVVSSNTTANLTALARKKGVIYFDDTTNDYKGDDGVSLISLGGSSSGAVNSPSTLENLGLSTSVGASALTINLKQSNGTSDPTGGSPVTVAFRSTTPGTGSFTKVDATSATSIVVPSGATLGHRDATNEYFYVYTLNNAGTAELAVSTSFLDEGSIVSTTAISAAADDNGIYSTVARSNVAIRLIARLLSNQTTAGTWNSNVSEISLASQHLVKIPKEIITATGSVKTPTSSNTWQQHTGNLIEVGVGTWEIYPYAGFSGTGGNPDHENTRLQLGAANGVDTAVTPALFSTLSGVTIDFGEEQQTPIEDSGTGTSLFTYTATNKLIVTLTEPQTAFVNTFWAGTGPTFARITPRILARRLGS